MAGGRPGHDISAEAKELIKWAQTDDALILRYFAPMRGFSTTTMYRWVEESDEFRDAFEYARDIIGCRRELMYLTAKSESPFKRYAPMYDKALHEFERGEKKFDADIDKEAKKEEAANATALTDRVFNQIERAREELAKRNQSNISK